MKRAWGRLAGSLALLLATEGCGYRAVHAGGETLGRLSVEAAPALVPDTEAQHAALAGARSELAREGVLGATGAHPRLLVEVVRVDAEAVGIATAGDGPEGRGARVTVVVRGWVEEEPGAPPSRVTGDLRRSYLAPEGTSATGAAEVRRSATRRAGELAGRALARHVLGIPTARD